MFSPPPIVRQCAFNEKNINKEINKKINKEKEVDINFYNYKSINNHTLIHTFINKKNKDNLFIKKNNSY